MRQAESPSEQGTTGRSRSAGTAVPAHPLGDAEIHFLWWFSQGSIMNPDIRGRLRRAWGMCARHAAGYLAVEASLRRGYMHGPALLYEDLMARAVAALAPGRVLQGRRAAARLRRAGPCLLCDMGYVRARGAPRSSMDVVAEGRDVARLRALADAGRPYWEPAVCGRCVGDHSAPRCREHLVQELAQGRVGDLEGQRDLVEHIARHLASYARSFRWEHRGTATDEDRAALICATGWCSGWVGLLDVCS